VSRASPWPPSGDRSKAVMVMVMRQAPSVPIPKFAHLCRQRPERASKS
jgi:hypothetical protein